jgi:hypothetical protein
MLRASPNATSGKTAQAFSETVQIEVANLESIFDKKIEIHELPRAEPISENALKRKKYRHPG